MASRKKLKQDKQRLTRLAEESISIQSFLSRVLGIRDNNILSGPITHSDIKALLPKLVRPSFEYIVDNPSLIYNGEVFLVEDTEGKIVPYFNPSYVYEEVGFLGTYVEQPKKKEEIPNINEIELSELSNYELQQLLHIYEQHGIRGAYRRVRNELTTRKDSRHASHESRERTLRKERKKRDYEE